MLLKTLVKCVAREYKEKCKECLVISGELETANMSLKAYKKKNADDKATI